jgi:hypothetical protein
VIKYMPGSAEAQSSNPSTTKGKEPRSRRRKRRRRRRTSSQVWCGGAHL